MLVKKKKKKLAKTFRVHSCCQKNLHYCDALQTILNGILTHSANQDALRHTAKHANFKLVRKHIQMNSLLFNSTYLMDCIC